MPFGFWGQVYYIAVSLFLSLKDWDGSSLFPLYANPGYIPVLSLAGVPLEEEMCPACFVPEYARVSRFALVPFTLPSVRQEGLV